MTVSNTHLVLLPSYNTGERLRGVVTEVLGAWQPVLVVIDGSTDGSTADVQALAREAANLTVLVQPRNAGKGAAVLAGARWAKAHGFTHILAMDADGQHVAAHIAELMAVSQSQPDALILGRPIFPANIPRERLYGRQITTALVRLQVLGRGIADPLFGFRVYPVAPLLDVLDRRRTGRRYDFDTEAAVRLFWAGVRPVNVAAPVRYYSAAEGGISHFNYLRDNLLLAGMHTRLIAEMIFRRVPAILRHRRRWRAAGWRSDAPPLFSQPASPAAHS